MSGLSGGTRPVDRLDESFTHQAVAPKRFPVTDDPRWAERSYYVVSLPGGGIMNAGRQLYANAGQRVGFLACRMGSSLHAFVATEEYRYGDDPDQPCVGAVCVTVLEPMKAVRIRSLDERAPLAVDLTYEARFPAVATDVNRIVRHGEVVTEYLNFFQPGRYTGSLRMGTEEITLNGRLGFRDRGWGVRKHEGAPARGLVFMVGCELESSSLYLFVYENARGERMFTNGWLIDERGCFDVVERVDHDLLFADGLFRSGTWRVRTERGRSLRVEGRTAGALYLSAVGYRREGHRGLDGHRHYDLADAEVDRELRGQTDYATDFVVDGERGYGYCEVGLGVHSRYRPESPGPLGS